MNNKNVGTNKKHVYNTFNTYKVNKMFMFFEKAC